MMLHLLSCCDNILTSDRLTNVYSKSIACVNDIPRQIQCSFLELSGHDCWGVLKMDTCLDTRQGKSCAVVVKTTPMSSLVDDKNPASIYMYMYMYSYVVFDARPLALTLRNVYALGRRRFTDNYGNSASIWKRLVCM